MDDNGWVKLYRKSLSNDIRRHDPTAWRLFETLLLLVDSQTGKWSGGIYQLTEADGYLKSSTIYKALNRLVEEGMITKKSNTRYSEIHICNFVEYHTNGKTSGKNQVKTGYKPSNTLTRSKKEEVRIHSKTPKRDVVAILNRVTGRNFSVEPPGAAKTMAKFTDEEIERALRNMYKDAWHGPRMGELGSDYLLRSTLIDRFKDYESPTEKYRKKVASSLPKPRIEASLSKAEILRREYEYGS